MISADSSEEMMQSCSRSWRINSFKIDASKLESLAAENKALNEQIARLEQGKELNHLISLKKLKTSSQAYVQKHKAYMSSLELYSSILDQKLSGLDEETDRV